MRRSLLVVTSAFVLSAPAAARAADGDIIVQRAPGADRVEVRADAGVELVEALPLERTELVEPAPGETLTEAVAALNADPDVVYAEPDRPAHVAAARRDTYFNRLWGLLNTGQNYGVAGADIDATLAWGRSEGEGVTVAVVDTGVNAAHVDLAPQLTGIAAERAGVPGVDDDGNGYVDDTLGWDFVSGDNLPQDGHGHGTHVAGTLAADGENEVGVIGVAPRARLLPLRALGNNGQGSMSAIAAAFDYAGDLGMRVVNASISGEYSRAVQDAIAAHPNTLFVVAAGNDGANANTGAKSFPCALPEANVVCVGASDNRDAPAAFSNYGETAVDVHAPGVEIISTYRRHATDFAVLSGTSMATPHVAGSAALALALRPDASTRFLRWALLSSVETKPGLARLSVTGGRLNADRALTAIQGAEPPVPTPTPTPEEPPPAPPAAEPPAATPAPVAPIATPAPSVTPAPAIGRLTIRKLKVSFRLSQATALKVTVKRGSKRVASWSVRGKAGANTISLAGRRLKRGSYRVTVAAGAVAQTASLRVR